MTMNQFVLDFQPKKNFRQKDRQTNFKLLHGNTIDNSITIKIRLKNGNETTHSKELAEQRYKKDFDVAL